MGTRKITGIIRNTRSKIINRLRQINKTNARRIGLLTTLLTILPLVVHADSGQNQKPEPLTIEQSQKLATNLAELNPTAKKEAKPIKIEVAPDPAPQTPAPEQAPEPTPAPVAAKTTRKVTQTATRKTSTGKTVIGSSYEQCVPFARELSGVPVYGYAGSIQPNSQEASVGSVALFAGYGHAAVVIGVNGDMVTIKEANYVPGKITERTVSASQLRGYVR